MVPVFFINKRAGFNRLFLHLFYLIGFKYFEFLILFDLISPVTDSGCDTPNGISNSCNIIFHCKTTSRISRLSTVSYTHLKARCREQVLS